MPAISLTNLARPRSMRFFLILMTARKFLVGLAHQRSMFRFNALPCYLHLIFILAL